LPKHAKSVAAFARKNGTKQLSFHLILSQNRYETILLFGAMVYGVYAFSDAVISLLLHCTASPFLSLTFK